VDCPSCGRANASERVECSHCEALLVDVFQSNEEKTDPIRAVGEDLSVHPSDAGADSGNGFTRFHADAQYSGDLPRLFRFGNRYQVLEKLGEGGMGRVYKALDLELDRPVALKTIRTEKGRGPDVLKRFKQELVLARKITHKNVVRIYDLGEAEGGVKFFTMELVEGQSLRDLLREKKTIPIREAISFMKQMLSGLAEAHSQGVVHRDLKPQNIMVDRSGLLRIMDFGIARTADTATLTGSGEMMGTPDYISPEQIKGENTTAQSDLYSAGIILYELLTGDVPFKGDTAISKVVARLQVKPTPPRTLNPQIPPYLERIVLKLMEVDPDLRYKTADDVLQDLEREQVDGSLFLRTRKALLRRRGWIAATLVGSLGIGAWGLLRNPSGEVSADVPVTTLAILPFHNMTGNAELEWMENGLPQMLITDISQSATLRPLLEDRVHRILVDLGKSGQTSFDEETLNAFANTARADYILHGRFLESEDRLRIDMILKERTTGVGTPVKMDGKSSEVFALVDAITERISVELDLDTLFDRNRPVSEVATSSLDAFREYQRGIASLQDGRNQAAIAALQQAVTLDPSFAMAYARLAEAEWNLGDSDGAKANIEKANSLALEHPLPPSERFQIHAIAARINDDPNTAIEAYRKLADFYPSDPDVMLGLASALESKGETSLALEAYQNVLNTSPGYDAALLGLGRALVTADRPLEAIPVLENAAQSGAYEKDLETTGMLYSILGVAYRITHDPARALECFQTSLEARRAIGDTRGTFATLINISIARRNLQQFAEASLSLEEAANAARESRLPGMESFALQSLGNLALETGQPERALDYYRASLDIEWDLKKDNEIAYRLDAIGDVLRLRGLYADSLVYLEHAKLLLNDNESSERGFNLSVLAQVKRARGEYDEAIQALLEAIPLLEPSDHVRDLTDARHALVEIYVEQGRFAEALAVIDQSLTRYEKESGTNLAAAKTLYGNVLIEVGDYEAAEEELKSAARLIHGGAFDRQPYYNYVWARLLAARGKEGSGSRFQESLDQAGQGRDALLASKASVAFAVTLLEDGRTAAGRKLLEEALGEATKLGHRAVRAEALLVTAESEIEAGNLAVAQRLLSESKEIAAGFHGRLLLTRVHHQLGRVAAALNDTTSAKQFRQESAQLVQWITNQVPPQHRDEFLGRLSTRMRSPGGITPPSL
jgi:serine/threonine protein kinase/tetratricopeptide (TPR) repeat protein